MVKKHVIFWVLVLMLLVLACSLLPGEETPTGVAEDAPPGTATTEGLPATTEPPATEESVAETPAPTVMTEAGCSLDARFVEDVTIPDNTALEPGEAFRKTWRIRNAGTCNWETGTQMVFVSGEPLGGPPSVVAPAAAAGAVVDVSVDFTAPVVPGSYRSSWRLQLPDGTPFGSTFFVKIVVPEPPTPVPTLTVAPTEEVTGTCAVAVDAELEPIMAQVDALGLDLGCPLGNAYQASGAFQEYWANVDNINPHTHYRSLMIWNVPYKQGEIYTFRGQDTDAYRATVTASYDSWVEPQPEIHPDCAGMTAPGGYVLPIRGFGKLWCENQLYDTIGWPAVAESAVTLRVQYMENGRLLKVSGLPALAYVVAWQYDDGAATVKMVAP